MNRDVGFALSIGITVTLALVGGVVLGLWLNAKSNIAPWGILIGMMLGIFTAIGVLIIRVRSIMK